MIARILGVLTAIHPTLPTALTAAILYGCGRAGRTLHNHHTRRNPR